LQLKKGHGKSQRGEKKRENKKLGQFQGVGGEIQVAALGGTRIAGREKGKNASSEKGERSKGGGAGW